MRRSLITTAHAASGAFALLTITAFWSSAVYAELALIHSDIAEVRTAIAYALPLLIALLATAGATGNRLARHSKAPVVLTKIRRMKLAAANGLLVLVPSAIFLANKAQAGEFDGLFAAVQAVELIAGATNIALLALNMRAGMTMRSRRLSKRRPAPSLVGERAA